MVCYWQKLILFLLIVCFLPNVKADPISLEIHDASLPEAIRLLAKFLHLNVIISSSVSGVATLNLHGTIPKNAFELLLKAHGLAKWQEDNILFIAPQTELIKRKQEELKWQELRNATMPLKIHIWQLKYAKAREIAPLLQNEHTSLLSKRGAMQVDTRTNIICIRDVMENIEILGTLIKHLDVPVKQIMIEARLASVDHDFERELGINFTTKSQLVKDKDTIPVKSMDQEVSRFSLAIAKLADNSFLDIKLSALEKAGHAEIISNPSLFTASQQSAFIEAGEEVPYQELSDSGGTAIVFKKAVLGLKVTPQVLPENKILLQLKINQDRPSNRMVQGVPTINTHQISTNVLVTAGQTIVLGGIYESNRENGQQRLPFISQIPLLGLLFKQQNVRTMKRELLIFVTPKIIA